MFGRVNAFLFSFFIHFLEAPLYTHTTHHFRHQRHPYPMSIHTAPTPFPPPRPNQPLTRSTFPIFNSSKYFVPICVWNVV
jgi:hypothetical protein